MNITKEEVQQVLGALHADPHTSDWDDAITLLQSKLVEPAHTDHPMRHHDRTCPACREDAEQAAINPMQKRADYLPPKANSL